MDALGRIRKLDARTIWQNEAQEFTPWMASAENIQHLAEAVGLELDVEDTEVAVGPFSADILARDASSGDFVVIENQLGRTDHDHLGKAITYAAFLNASAIVWLATRFTDEHRKALDWLNDNTSSELSVFGVAVELWQIDDSRPAVRFNVLSRPPESIRRSDVVRTGALTDTKRLQLEWWTLFREKLLEAGIVGSAQSPRPRYWYNVALGKTGIVLSNVCDTWGGRIGVRVYMVGRHNGDAALEQLMQQRGEIEAELGMELHWNPNPENRDKTIAVFRDIDLSARDEWDEHIGWLVDTTAKFREVFGPRVKALDLTVQPSGEEGESVQIGS